MSKEWVVVMNRTGVGCFAKVRKRLCGGEAMLWVLVGLAVAGFGVAAAVYAGSESEARASLRTFTLQQAIETALQRNPEILRARQEIERTKGLIIQVRASALPHLDALANYTQTQPSVNGTSSLVTTGSNTGVTGVGTGTGVGASATPGVTPVPNPSASPVLLPTATPIGIHGETAAVAAAAAAASPTATASGTSTLNSVQDSGSSSNDKSYSLRFQVTQLLYSGGQVHSALRAADFERDISYFQLRNSVDQIISTVRTQFYQVILDKELIGVQEESVRLLQSQLNDQQNRFEAGTVPRFNVLQAEVALSNQNPALITARNNYRISQLQLAKTLGLDFDPRRGDNAPLAVKGTLTYEPRHISLPAAIELGKERRPFLKQQRANILAEIEQVQVSLAGYKPTLSLSGGYQFRNRSDTLNIRDVTEGWFFGLTGDWALFDGFATAGKVKQARALLAEAKISYDDAVRQVELEVQQTYSELQEGRQLIESQAKNVDQAQEALRLASARLDAGAGTQLEVLASRVALTTARSTQLQALYTYNAALAEFDRVTATDTIYRETFDDPLLRKQKNSAAATRRQ